MGMIENALYDEPIRWIRKRRDKNTGWDAIRMANKPDLNGLKQFLTTKTEDDDWEPMTVDDWIRLVDECMAFENKHESILFRGNEGALYDTKQDNGLSVPQGERSCWQLYKASLGWKKESIQDLEDATIGILRRLSKDTRQTGPIKGLVVGHVQSGKTANMEALMAMSADHGWNMFIVLSGTIESLRLQTLRRMQKDLNTNGNLNWIGIEHPSKKSPYGQRALDCRFSGEATTRYFTVCLKNAARLRALIDWIHADKASHDSMRILIIDDEADQASISNTATSERNPNAEKKERKGINKLIVKLVDDVHYKDAAHSKGNATAINYVMYTATPYANFLNEASEESLYPRHFIWTLKTSDEYIGPNQIFGIEENDYDGLDIVRNVTDSDLVRIKDIYNEESTELPESMKDSICWFICAVSVMRYWGYKKSISMLVHTSQKQVYHEVIANAIAKYFKNNRSGILLSRCKQIYKYETAMIPKDKWLLLFYGGYGVDPELIRDYPEFDLIEPFIQELLQYEMQHIKMDDDSGDLQYHAGLHLVIDNCSKNGITNGDDHIRLAYPECDPNSEEYPKPAPAFIIVGGSTLSRGLTIEGLVSTFFLRASCQADTLMQMGRWFGYRRDYELMPRIWMTEDTVGKFQFLSQLEVELREDLKRYMFDNVSPADYGPRIKLSPKVSWLRLTSRNHMVNSQETDMDYSGVKPQTTIFENDVAIQQRNIQITEEFLEALPGKPIRSDNDNAVYWEHISLSLIMEFFVSKGFSFSNRSRVFNEVGLFFEWLKKAMKDQSLNQWTVIVAGNDTVTQDEPDEKHWKVRDFTVGKINRSKRSNTPDETSIDIGILRSLRDHTADLPGAGKIAVTTQAQVDKLRKEAGKAHTPYLIIYRIDKDSTVGKNGSSGRRENLNFGSDIISIQFCIPGEEINASHSHKVTVYLPEKDREDEVEDYE